MSKQAEADAISASLARNMRALGSYADDLKSLGATDTTYAYPDVSSALLELFPCPEQFQRGLNTVLIVAPEFTSLCPKTGQPDFATIVIEYMPHLHCVESKSLKLYLGSFRNSKAFHEECVGRISEDLHALLNPKWLCVEGQFTPRGGIPFWPRQVWASPELLPAVIQRIERNSRVLNGHVPKPGW